MLLHRKIYSKYKTWKYKNTALLILSILFIFYFVETSFGKNIINSLIQINYLGAFISGIFFVYTFSVVPAGIVLFKLAEQYNFILISMCGGLGAMLGDYIIFKFLRDNVFDEIKPIFNKLGGNNLSRLFNTPYFSWFIPVLGAAIIASPFPDEVGVSLMGLSKVKKWQFLIVTFILNTIGIFIITFLAK